ncbi:MAG: urease accessory protein UreE [Pseudomonadota bacterium]
MFRVSRIGKPSVSSPQPFAQLALDSGDRHVRRKVVTLQSGERILIDLDGAHQLAGGDRLVLEDHREIEIVARPESLLEVKASDTRALAVLAWHIGNRHLPAEIEIDRILIQTDHVIRDMLVGLGATVRDIEAPFQPERGAYHGHSHGHEHP